MCTFIFKKYKSWYCDKVALNQGSYVSKKTCNWCLSEIKKGYYVTLVKLDQIWKGYYGVFDISRHNNLLFYLVGV